MIRHGLSCRLRWYKKNLYHIVILMCQIQEMHLKEWRSRISKQNKTGRKNRQNSDTNTTLWTNKSYPLWQDMFSSHTEINVGICINSSLRFQGCRRYYDNGSSALLLPTESKLMGYINCSTLSILLNSYKLCTCMYF